MRINFWQQHKVEKHLPVTLILIVAPSFNSLRLETAKSLKALGMCIGMRGTHLITILTTISSTPKRIIKNFSKTNCLRRLRKSKQRKNSTRMYCKWILHANIFNLILNRNSEMVRIHSYYNSTT